MVNQALDEIEKGEKGVDGFEFLKRLKNKNGQ